MPRPFPRRSTTLDNHMLALEHAETRAARQVALAYNDARREIVDYLLRRWTGAATLTPGASLDLMRRLALLRGVEKRLAALERQTGVVLRDVVRSSTELALETMGREMALLPPEFRAPLGNFAALEAPMIERFLPQALAQAQVASRSVLVTMTRHLQSGLAQGLSFPDLVARLMGATPVGETPAVWRNGATSAQLMVRRTVITAANQAKLNVLDAVNARGATQVRKQWMAVINERTTDCCLRAHGQIQRVGDPFILTGTPQFAPTVQAPPAHWNCRSSVVMHHPLFEQGAMTTASMQSSAQSELSKRAD